jgi:hypothetical protein
MKMEIADCSEMLAAIHHIIFQITALINVPCLLGIITEAEN